jgi:transposase
MGWLSRLAQRAKETAVQQGKDIVLVVDYHAENIEFRWYDESLGKDHTGNFPTKQADILRLLEQATAEVEPGGQVVWIMESTTGWARVKDLLGDRVRFVLVNVVQMPLPPKARRRKSDKIDTARILREYLNGQLPTSFQPSDHWRQARRIVDARQDLVERQTAIRNWISSLLHHETWEDRQNLWSGAGLARLRSMKRPAGDRLLVDLRLEQLEHLAQQQQQVEAQMQVLYDAWREAQWLDAVRGIGMVTAVSLLAHIGPIERFASPEDLISYAGLAPGVQDSDGTIRHGHLGGGGTDGHLRYLLIEASIWLRQIPRYRPTYERILAKRGKKIARIVVARLFVRSLYKMLREKVCFHPGSAQSAGKPNGRRSKEVTTTTTP